MDVSDAFCFVFPNASAVLPTATSPVSIAEARPFPTFLLTYSDVISISEAQRDKKRDVQCLRSPRLSLSLSYMSHASNEMYESAA